MSAALPNALRARFQEYIGEGLIGRAAVHRGPDTRQPDCAMVLQGGDGWRGI